MAAKSNRTSDFQNPDHVSPAQFESLVTHFGLVPEEHAEIVQKTLRYIMDGGDEEILLTLGGKPEIAKSLVLSPAMLPANSPNGKQFENANRQRAKLFWPEKRPGAAFWVRLAKVFSSLLAATNTKLTYAPFPDWLTLLIGFVLATTAKKSKDGWGVAEWRSLLKQSEVSETTLIPVLLKETERDLLFKQFGTFGYYYFGFHDDVFSKLPGWKELLADHEKAVRETIQNADATSCVHAITSLHKIEYDYRPILDLMVDLAIGNSKQVREAALGTLTQHKAVARPLLEKKLHDGDASQRNEAVNVLWKLEGQEIVAVLKAHRDSEKSERVRQTIDKLIAAPTGQDDTSTAMTLPPIEIETGAHPFPEEGKTAIREFYDKQFKDAMVFYEKQLAEAKAATDKRYVFTPYKPKEVPALHIENMLEFLEGKRPVSQVLHYAQVSDSLGEWFAPPGVKLVHVVRMLVAWSLIFRQGKDISSRWHLSDLDTYRNRCKPPFGLREVDVALADVFQCDRGKVGWLYLEFNTSYTSFCDWEPEAVWPFFAEYPQFLQELLSPGFKGINEYRLDDARRNGFKVLAMMPRLPAQYIPLLWDIAVGESKTWRIPAQKALATVPDKTAKILIALGDGKQSVRIAAAEWLGRLGDSAAIDPLKKAFKGEKQETVKGAIMLALGQLGASVEEFLDRDELFTEAKKGLEKKRPKGMEWVPMDHLPALHWKDNGNPVSPSIVEWWLVQSIQQKLPSPGPLLQRYLELCKKDEAAKLAQFILRAWVGRDTAHPSHEEASKLARADADKNWSIYSGNKYYVDIYNNDKENLYKEIYNRISAQCLHSAINEKGMLSIVAAAGDLECVKLCEQYIRQWSGSKLAQCKCLIEVLAWLEHPNAIQVLLSISNRFRTKAIREGATQHVSALAERKGWTIDELADRTIPDGGFERPVDADGKPVGDEAILVLDYGPRSFNVKLNDDLEPVITSAEGKAVKNPPAPGQKDDPEKAKAAKKAFSDAKKTVKDVVKRQAERFYEGLCTQRTWRYDDWRVYLAQHPIVGRLVSRLVWAAWAPSEAKAEPEGTEETGEFLGCFRLLEDGSLSNEKDEEVKLPADTRLRLAHTCNVPAEQEPLWLQHLADYDVEPLFAQFNRPIYQLPEENKKHTAIKDFEGHMITTFKLRGKANMLGYIRGAAEDGGVFCEYNKSFQSLGIQAVITFSGSALPETDVPAALHNLEFQRISASSADQFQGRTSLALEKIPAVLLSECYNDMKQIAADGTGFQADWQKATYF